MANGVFITFAWNLNIIIKYTVLTNYSLKCMKKGNVNALHTQIKKSVIVAIFYVTKSNKNEKKGRRVWDDVKQ